MGHGVLRGRTAPTNRPPMKPSAAGPGEIEASLSARRPDRRGIPALPFCHWTLRAPKAPTPRLPGHLHHLGDHLKRRRLELGLNRTAMAKRLKIEVSAYCRWEKGATIPELHRRDQIAAHLGYRPPVPVPSDAPLGTKVRAWRVAHGLTIAQAARQVGVDPKTLGTLERGRQVSESTRAAASALLATVPVGPPPATGTGGSPAGTWPA